jgi:hypothetical protein
MKSTNRLSEIRSASDRFRETCATNAVSDIEIRFREALSLWLRWNEAYEQATQIMCRPGQSQQQLEEFMDRMDSLRREAIDLSQELLD